MSLILAFIAVAIASIGQIGLKIAISHATEGRPLSLSDPSSLVSTLFHPGVIGSIALYGVSSILWVIVLSRTPVSSAYPILGLSFAVVPILSYVFLHERFDPISFAGASLILAGVIVVGMRG